MSLKKRGDDILNAVALGMSKSASIGAPKRAEAPKTAIGSMIGDANQSLRERLNESESARQAEADKAAEVSLERDALKEQVSSGRVVLELDPARVRHSKFADRSPTAFSGPVFEEFCELIRSTGGNNEPGRVRPVTDDDQFDYELVTGHRRHAACALLKLPFYALAEDASDLDLIKLMHMENQGRLNLSSYEQGISYANILADGLFKSARELASEYKKKFSVMQRLLRYGALPDLAIDAFEDPREIRVYWVEHLIKTYEANETAFREEVARLAESPTKLTASQIYKRLIGQVGQRSIIANQEKVVGSIRMIHDRPAIVLFKGAPEELINQIKLLVSEWTTTHNENDK